MPSSSYRRNKLRYQYFKNHNKGLILYSSSSTTINNIKEFIKEKFIIKENDVVIPIYDFSRIYTNNDIFSNFIHSLEYKLKSLIKISAMPLSFCLYYLYDNYKKEKARKRELVMIAYNKTHTNTYSLVFLSFA